jgi:hypothetical protein
LDVKPKLGKNSTVRQNFWSGLPTNHPEIGDWWSVADAASVGSAAGRIRHDNGPAEITSAASPGGHAGAVAAEGEQVIGWRLALFPGAVRTKAPLAAKKA